MNSSGEYDTIESGYQYNDTTNLNRFVAYKNPFRYRSYYYDFETGLYYLNSRYYDPETGRFINADNINKLSEAQEFINGLNLYAYCNNNPILYTDDSGEAWWDWLWKILVAIVIVVAVTVATVFTAGAAALAITGSIGITMGVMGGALVGGLVSGAVSIIGQCITNGIEKFNFGAIAIDTFTGATFGAISGGVAIAGTTSAQIIGGIAKVVLSGIGSILHGINNGSSAKEIFSEAGLSMFLTALTQGALIGLGKLPKFGGGQQGKFGQFIKKIINFVNDHFDFKIAITSLISGIKDILKE